MVVAAIRSASLALAIVAAGSEVASANVRGGRGGPMFRSGVGFHGLNRGFAGGWAGGARFGGGRGLPPIGGVIHERAGARPYVSAYGHTDTAMRFGGYRGYGAAGYGHLGTGLRYGGLARGGVGRRRFVGYGLGGGYALGGYGLGGYGYGAPGLYGDVGVYGGQGTYGAPGTYGSPGTYGGYGTTATQSVYGNGGVASYRSERPLAARFAEPPLGPSPYAPYSPDDRYAYAASEDVRPAPRVVNPYGGARSGCACAPGAVPIVYRYGVGTAY